jgi:hypothetical protein
MKDTANTASTLPIFTCQMKKQICRLPYPYYEFYLHNEILTYCIYDIVVVNPNLIIMFITCC